METQCIILYLLLLANQIATVIKQISTDAMDNCYFNQISISRATAWTCDPTS